MKLNITYHARRKYAKLKCLSNKQEEECKLDCSNVKLAHINCRFLRRRIDDEIQELFAKSVEEEPSGDFVNRVMRNNFQAVKYFRFDIYRFVVLEKDNKLVTIEKNTFTRSSKEKGYMKKSDLGNRIQK